MNKMRYVDKNILCMYDFEEEFFQILGLTVQDIVPLRKVFVLFTDKGKKILKLIDSSDERIDFINKSLKYIEKSFENVLKYYENINGDIVTNWNGKRYVVLELLIGRECAFTNPIEIDLCTKAISEMHIASKGLINTLTEEEIENHSAENLLDKMIREKKYLIKIEEFVKKYKYKNKFDKLFLDNIDLVKKDLDKSITLINSSEYSNLIKNRKNLVLCHNDLAHHNFIIDNDEVKIIDFDYCKLDIKIMDIYNYIIKAIKNLGYSKETMDNILKVYNENLRINKDEAYILNSLLHYPKDFISIALLYYFKGKEWDEAAFISKIENKIELDEFRRELIENIKKNK